jgi:hypothetical protein
MVIRNLVGAPGYPHGCNTEHPTGAAMWGKGVLVVVKVWHNNTWVLHPRGTLRILDKPLPSTRETEGITVSVGCELTYRDLPQEATAESLAKALTPTPNSTQSLKAMIANVLEEAKIATSKVLADLGNIQLSSGATDKKPGESWTKKAGELAFGNAQTLYQDSAGNIQSLSNVIAVQAAPTFIYSLPCGDVYVYRPIKGAENTSEETKGFSYSFEMIEYWNTKVNEFIQRVAAASVDPRDGGIIIGKRVERADTTSENRREVTESIWMPKGAVMPFSRDVAMILAETSTETYNFDGDKSGKLRSVTKIRSVRAGIGLRSLISAIGQTGPDNNPYQGHPIDPMAWVQVNQYTDYAYTGEEVVKTRTTHTKEPNGEIAAQAYAERWSAENTIGTPYDLSTSEFVTDEWIEQRPDEWFHRRSRLLAKGKSGIEVEYPSGTSFTQKLNERLALTGGDDFDDNGGVSASGQVQPPSTERKQPRFRKKSKPITAFTANIATGADASAKESTIAMPYATPEALPKIIEAESVLLIGRKTGRELQFAFDSNWITNTNPWPIVHITDESGDTQIYMANAVQYLHEREEALVACKGVWLGTIPATVQIPNPANPAQLITVPGTIANATVPYNRSLRHEASLAISGEAALIGVTNTDSISSLAMSAESIISSEIASTASMGVSGASLVSPTITNVANIGISGETMVVTAIASTASMGVSGDFAVVPPIASVANMGASGGSIVGIPYVSQLISQIAADGAPALSSTEVNALVAFLGELTANGTLSRYRAIYTFPGATAATQRYNLLNAQDSDAAYRLVFSGSAFTHSALGVTPPGNNHADTFLPPSALPQDSARMAYYSRTNAATGTLMGVGSWTGNRFSLLPEWGGGYGSYDAINGLGNNSTASPTSRDGLLAVNRSSSTVVESRRNGVNYASTSGDTSVAPRTETIWLFGGNSGSNYTSLPCGFAAISEGLTPAEEAADYTAVQNLMTALGRNV